MTNDPGRIDYEKALNSEQLATVTAPDGPLFVLAAAGTGKTRTLVYRVAYLIERAVDPRRTLLLTFTNRAAKEMMERAEALVGQRVGGLWGGTFHHMANRILRRHASALGYANDFTILDRDDSESLVRSCINDLKLKGREFPKPEVLVAILSAAVNRRAALQQAIEERFLDTPVNPEDVLKVFKRYEEQKRKLDAMDFDDLLVNGLKLFVDHADILARYQEQFLYVLVDEYQDTNPIQADWVDRIAARYRNLMVVGDDFQSIYSWRGVDYRNILTFPQRYPDARMFKLETNYRSIPEILAVANCCIAGNPAQFQKTLHATRPEHRKPTLAVLHDADHQSRYVVQQIKQLRRDGCRWTDIAVLYRAHYHAMELQLALSREHVPYIVTSGVRFFEQAHVKDVCSLLRILHNPEDQLAFCRLLAMLPGVGDKTALKLWNRLGQRFETGNNKHREQLLEQLPGAAQSPWKAIQPILEAYHTDHLNEDPGEVIFQFLKAFYHTYVVDTFEDDQRRIEDLEQLITFTTEFESNESFLSEVALITNLDAESERVQGAVSDSVRLSTVHQAKGLEWNAVIILWLADGLFPSSRSMMETGGEAEERRLFYVALTRAKDELFLCAPAVRRAADGSVNFLSPSRFITEIPSDLLKTEQVGFIV